MNERETAHPAEMERALVSLGRKDLQSLIDEDHGAELGCHFCHSKYFFSTEELRRLLTRAEEKGEEQE